MNENQEVKTETIPPANIMIDFDGKKFTVVVPVEVGKIGAYGAFVAAQELASKVFWAMEKKAAEEEAKSKSILRSLHIPGLRTQ